jgi:hypothetical protein
MDGKAVPTADYNASDGSGRNSCLSTLCSGG